MEATEPIAGPSSSPRLEIDDNDVDMSLDAGPEPTSLPVDLDEAELREMEEDPDADADAPDAVDEDAEPEVPIDETEEALEDAEAGDILEKETAGKKGRKKGKEKEKRDPPPQLARESGKSLLPFSRVNKIIKADKEVNGVAKEATYLISLATEEFIKRLAETAWQERKGLVSYKDLANVVRRVDEFMFLDEIIPPMDNLPPPKRKPKALSTKDPNAPPTALDAFLKGAGPESESQNAGAEVLMNEDGTMSLAPPPVPNATDAPPEGEPGLGSQRR